jgi:hypothetical protein
VRDVLRYLPEIPFKPTLSETFQKKLGFYEDYCLVRLAPTSGDETSAPVPEVYGLYAPGDLRPLDEFGRTIE